MNRHWVLREELYRIFHRWPIMIAFFALGCLIGWLCSIMWPSYYRSTSQIYVGLNPYRAYSDSNFLALAKPKYANIDNYLYWQMNQLDGVIFLDDFIQDTLNKLRETDSYWAKVSDSQLQEMLDSEWRTAGLWSLIAEHPDQQRATQAVQAWSKVVTKRVKGSVQSARNVFVIDQKLQVVAAELLKSQFRQQDLLHTENLLLEWVKVAQYLPKDQPLNLNERWRIIYLSTHLAQLTPPWKVILEAQPSEGSLPEAYLNWIAQITLQMDIELSELQLKIADLEEEHSQLERQYSSEADKSLSLSPNLEIKEVKDLPTRIIRPASTLILIGGIVGLLIWVLTQLVIISNRERGS